MATNSSKAAAKASAPGANNPADAIDDGPVVDSVECEILTSIRYGREVIEVGQTTEGKPIMKPHGKPKRLVEGDTEELTLDEAERYEAMGAVKILMSAKNRESLRARLTEQAQAARRRPAAAPAE
jgi:hypothetical protein